MALLGMLLVLSACAQVSEMPPGGAVAAMPGWGEDELAEWAVAWQRSCRLTPWRKARGLDESVRAAWRCRCAESVPREPEALREWVESNFRAKVVDSPAFITGYFEPSLEGRFRPEGEFRTPLYRMPIDWPSHRPLPDRAAIEAGALTGHGLEIVWVDAVDAFFLHIQGSGSVLLPGENPLRLGYAGHNGHEYRAIGRDLVEQGELARGQVSMQSIKAWLRMHPTRAIKVMQRNRRFIFFRELEGPGPIGSQGVALTPERSLAVDPHAILYGLPVWLDLAAGHGVPAIRRLTVAQDTGSAIQGSARGDFFWGQGKRAEAMAGRMQSHGTLYKLTPQWRSRTNEETHSCSKS